MKQLGYKGRSGLLAT